MAYYSYQTKSIAVLYLSSYESFINYFIVMPPAFLPAAMYLLRDICIYLNFALVILMIISSTQSAYRPLRISEFLKPIRLCNKISNSFLFRYRQYLFFTVLAPFTNIQLFATKDFSQATAFVVF